MRSERYLNHDSISIERGVKDALDRGKRKSNVIVISMPDTNLFWDDMQNLSKLMHDLDLDGNMIDSINRVGHPSAKPKPLRVQMRSEWCRNVLDSAYMLKSMARRWPKFGISPDRTLVEIEAYRNLMQQFRRRHSQGKQIRLDDDKIKPLHYQLPSSSQRSVDLPSRLSTDQQTSPLHVLLSPPRTSYCPSLPSYSGLLQPNNVHCAPTENEVATDGQLNYLEGQTDNLL